MFLSKRIFDYKVTCLENELKFMGDRYWELYHKHERLLKHLGLSEHAVPATVELRPKGGPERGDA